MHRTALIGRLGVELAQALHQSETLVGDDELHALESPAGEMPQEVLPGRLVLFRALGDAEYLAETVFADADGSQEPDVMIGRDSSLVDPTGPLRIRFLFSKSNRRIKQSLCDFQH